MHVVLYYWVLRRLLRKRPELRRLLVGCRHCRIFFFTHPRNSRRDDLGCPFGCRREHCKRESAKRSAEFYRGKAGKLKKKLHNARRQAKDQSAEDEVCSQDATPLAAAPASVAQQTPEASDSAETPPESAEQTGAGLRAEKREVNKTLAQLRDGRGEEEAPAPPVEARETRDSESPQTHAAEDREAEKGPAAVKAQANPAPVGHTDESSGGAEGDEFDEGIIEHVQLLASLIDGEDLSRQETIDVLKRVMRQRSIAKESALDYALRQLKQKPP